MFDEGEPGEETIHSNEAGFTMTPESDNSSIFVHYALPASYVLEAGIHTVKVYAANELNLEDNDSLEFYVSASSALPRISWTDSVQAPNLPWNGIFSGSNTLETAKWFHTSAVRLQFDSGLAPLNNFKIYKDDTMQTATYAKTFIAGTKTAVIGDALTGFTDKTGYYAVLADKLGNATTMYFHLDKTGPVIESTATSRISADGSGFHFDVAGQTYGGVSGINGEVVLRLGDVPNEEYTGPSYPPGSSTKTFSFSDITETKQLEVFERSGWIGTYDLLVEQSTDTLGVSI